MMMIVDDGCNRTKVWWEQSKWACHFMARPLSLDVCVVVTTDVSDGDGYHALDYGGGADG